MNPFAIVSVIAASLLLTVLILVIWLRRVEEDRRIRDEAEYRALLAAIAAESRQTTYNAEKMTYTRPPSAGAKVREGLKQLGQDLFGSLDFDVKVGKGGYGASAPSSDQHCDNPGYNLVCLS